MKLTKLSLFAALSALVGAGCDKSATPDSRSTVPYALTSQTVAHFHWLGKKQLAVTTNAASLMRIWNQPESAAVEAQALDKLSTAPWRLLPHVATTNSTVAAPRLRSLLDDCVQAESYFEVRAATNQPVEIAFAIQLSADRAALWQTNLAAVLESLTGLRTEPTEKGWTLKKHELPNRIELTRVGGWVVVGIGQDQNALFGDFVARILRDHTPITRASADFWAEGSVDLPRLIEAFKLDWRLPGNLSKIAFNYMGDGQNLQTRGTLNFSQPLALPLEPWNVPTNLIRGGIGSFTALRGLAPWLGSQKIWRDLDLGPAPNQLFVWAGHGIPMQTLFAFPEADATNRLAQITNSLPQKVSPRLVAQRSGQLEASTDFAGLSWTGLPFLVPYLRPFEGFIYGGFFTAPVGRSGLPPQMLMELNRTNTFYYDWELTGPRIESWIYIGQTLRLTFHKSQLPPSPALDWLQANRQTLGNCVTVATRSGADQLAFSRTSAGVGFTAFELHLLADWLVSADFPAGLNTTRGRVPTVKPGKGALPPTAPASR